ncbi:MAG: PD-(D/E)XK nuclease family protein, partial [Pseudomonadota bacterium]
DSWLNQGQLQLALYSLALIDGVLDDQPRDVVAAFFYGLKNMNMTKGFAIKEADPEFVKPSRGMARDKLNGLIDQWREELAKVLVSMDEGRFEPLPKKEEDCQRCRWNKLCRYPNLNQ